MRGSCLLKPGGGHCRNFRERNYISNGRFFTILSYCVTQGKDTIMWGQCTNSKSARRTCGQIQTYSILPFVPCTMASDVNCFENPGPGSIKGAMYHNVHSALFWVYKVTAILPLLVPQPSPHSTSVLHLIPTLFFDRHIYLRLAFDYLGNRLILRALSSPPAIHSLRHPTPSLYHDYPTPCLLK